MQGWRIGAWAVAMAVAPGCYSGASATGGDGGETDAQPSSSSDGPEPTGGGEGESDSEGPAADDCSTIDLSASPLRRLTREQYDYTIRDLLKVDSVPSSALDGLDEKVGPFDSNVVSPITTVGVSSLLDIAEQMAGLADLAQVAPCNLDAIADGDPQLDACVDSFVRDFGARALRRPLAEDEVARYKAVYETTRALEGPASGARQVVATMLQSPYFLYQVELGVGEPDARGWVPLSGHELAARLSYFLWSSMPDDALRQAADAGELADDAQVLAQLDRMLGDERARRGLGSFVVQWMELDHLDWVEKSPHPLVPEFDAAIRDAMKREATDFLAMVLREDDARLATLLTAPYSPVPPELYSLYGVEAPADPTAPVQLDPARRAGLLTQVGWLATHARPEESSPVMRGVVVLENLQCFQLAAPPNNIFPPPPDPNATTRERFEKHTSVEACAGCHVYIDGIGFGFEGYDAMGAYRSLENGLPIDESGTLRSTDGSGPDRDFVGPVELAHLLAADDAVRDCVALQWTRFALGRSFALADQCQVGALQDRFAANDGDMRQLMSDIVTSPAFKTLVIAQP